MTANYLQLLNEALCARIEDIKGTQAARDAMFHAAEFSVDDIEDARTALKRTGVDKSIPSKWYGKNGAITLAHANPNIARDFLNTDGANLTSPQTLYTRFNAYLKSAANDKPTDVEGVRAERLAREAAGAEKAAAAATRAVGKLAAAQVLGSLLDAAGKIADVNERREWIDTILIGLNDALGALDEEVARIEREAAAA